MRAQCVLVLADLIKCAVEPVVVDRLGVDPEQLVECGRVIPMLGHAEFGRLSAKSSDGEQGGHLTPRDALASKRQKLCEQRFQAETMPKREREVRLAEVRLRSTRKARRPTCSQRGAEGSNSKPAMTGVVKPAVRISKLQSRQTIPAAIHCGQLCLVEFTKRSDHL